MTQKLTLELTPELGGKLDAAVAATGIDKEDLPREALEQYLEDIEDYRIAMSRLDDPDDAVVSMAEMSRRVGLES